MTLRRCPGRAQTWSVDLEGGAEGRPALVLEPGSPVVDALRACPVGVLVLPPPGPSDRSALRLTARFSPLRAATTDGRRRYRSELLAVCLVGAERRPVEPAAFASAEPDPLRHSAARVVDHLATRHRVELLACLRAQGYDALDVVPRAVRLRPRSWLLSPPRSRTLRGGAVQRPRSRSAPPPRSRTQQGWVAVVGRRLGVRGPVPSHHPEEPP